MIDTQPSYQDLWKSFQTTKFTFDTGKQKPLPFLPVQCLSYEILYQLEGVWYIQKRYSYFGSSTFNLPIQLREVWDEKNSQWKWLWFEIFDILHHTKVSMVSTQVNLILRSGFSSSEHIITQFINTTQDLYISKPS